MALKRVDYDERQYAVYAAGRAMAEDARANWMGLFAEHLPPERPLPLIDLGSGVGRLTPALAEAFGGPVWGVEPSRRMREVAVAAGAGPAVRYVAGEAADIPLADDAVAGVLMFLSFHHVPDRAAAAAEIARVLRPGGRLLIHSGFSERMAGGSWWHQFFPRALEIEMQMFPTVDEAVRAFEPVGLRRLAFVQTSARFWNSTAEAAQRLRLRPYSTFEHLSEDEIAQGFARLDAAVAA
jgi:ubiquinone/menaquinone biosynthesis C-methylase UbiE